MEPVPEEHVVNILNGLLRCDDMPFPAICFSIASSFPGRGPGFFCSCSAVFVTVNGWARCRRRNFLSGCLLPSHRCLTIICEGLSNVNHMSLSKFQTFFVHLFAKQPLVACTANRTLHVLRHDVLHTPPAKSSQSDGWNVAMSYRSNRSRWSIPLHNVTPFSTDPLLYDSCGSASSSPP